MVVRSIRVREVGERGNVLLVAVIAMTGLLSLAGVTALSVQDGLATSSADRFASIALEAAESGAAVGMDYLRKHLTIAGGGTTKSFPSTLVSPSNSAPPQPADLPGNNQLPGTSGNLLAATMNAWYTVELLNNRGDSGYAAGTDTDGDLILRVTGHGPDGASAQIELEVSGNSGVVIATPCPSYGQKDIAESGNGDNDCLTAVSSASSATYRPGGP